MWGFVRKNTLQEGDGGYGKDRFSCDMIRDMFHEVKAELGLICVPAPFLRWMCEHNGIKISRTEGDGEEAKEVLLKRAHLEVKLAEELKLAKTRPLIL